MQPLSWVLSWWKQHLCLVGSKEAIRLETTGFFAPSEKTDVCGLNYFLCLSDLSQPHRDREIDYDMQVGQGG